MDEHKKNKINNFLNDEFMSNAVKEVLRESFLRYKDREDIHLLAASRIAIDLLEEGWKDLNKLRNEVKTVDKSGQQIGL